MKSWIKTLLTFVLGLLIGGAASFVYMAFQYNKMLALWHGASVVEVATNAHQIRAGQADKLLQRLDTALPSLVMTHATMFRSSPDYVSTLWTVQRYYEENPDLKVPPDLKAILATLPPRPPTSCEISSRQAASTQPIAPSTSPTGE